MSRTNSAPGSPIIGSARTNSPRMNRSFRVGSIHYHGVIRTYYYIDVLFKGEKDIGVGELANRMRRMQQDGYKNRRGEAKDCLKVREWGGEAFNENILWFTSMWLH